MFRAALCVIVVVAGASAAPYYHDYEHHHHHGPDFYQAYTGPHHHHHDYIPSTAFGQDMFDTRKFWMDLSREMMSFDQMMQDFYRRFPTTASTAVYVDGKYKITIPLTGFDEKEITVKSKNNMLMVQAVHTGDIQDIQKTYLDARLLPTDVDQQGTWTYDAKTLVIVFPLKPSTGEDKDTSDQESTETDAVDQNRQSEETETTERQGSREEMDTNQHSENTDADVGLRTNHNNEDIETNMIPSERSRTEGTTYAVDFKDEVEFVTVSY